MSRINVPVPLHMTADPGGRGDLERNMDEIIVS